MADRHADDVAPEPTYEECMERAEACRQHARHLRDRAAEMGQKAKAWEERADYTKRPCPQCGVAFIDFESSCWGFCASCYEAALNDGSGSA